MSKIKRLFDFTTCMFCGAKTENNWFVCNACDDINGGDQDND